MITVCVATALHPQARQSFRKHAPLGEVVQADAADWRAYWRVIAARWGRGDDLLIVEHDVILHEAVLPQLESCLEPWCLFPYRHPGCGPSGWMMTGLGCTRFRREFQDRVTLEEIASQAGNCSRCDGKERKHECWMHLDGRIREAGERLGFTAHAHWPSAGHRSSPPGELPESVSSRSAG